MAKLRKSELTPGRQVAYQRDNNLTLATILEIKKRVKIDDEGEERWVTPESLHSLDRLPPESSGVNYSPRLKVAASIQQINPAQVAQKLSGVSPVMVVVGAFLMVVLLGVLYYYVSTGQVPLPAPETVEALATTISEGDADSLFESETPTPVTTSSGNGQWYELYFTTPIYPDREENRPAQVPIVDALVTAINNAQRSLDIAIYELNLPAIGEAILAAQSRGVTVRLVTDSDEIDELAVLINLHEQGVPMVEDERSAIMHNKFVVVDNQAVWTGSWNFTPNGTYRNNNSAIYIRSPELAAIYHQEFEELFSGQFGPTSPSQTNPQVQIDGTSITVCFAPEDECAAQLVNLVTQAQRSIYVMAFSFTHDELGQAMLDRGRAGVTVRAIFENRGSGTQYSELTALQQAGFDAVSDGNPYTYHHKVIIVDDRWTVVGSFNFSNNADQSNDENLLIIDNSEIAAQYIAEFERNYQQVLNPPND